MRRYWQYLKYVLRHKWFVFWECRKLGVPLWIAILHDWDKFLPDEWFPYARTFYAPNGKKQYVESIDFARAWMNHQHRNKHHWQFWLGVDNLPISWTNIMVWDRGNAQYLVRRNSGLTEWTEVRDVEEERIAIDEMPDLYIREMVADWRGAGLANGNADTLDWYRNNKDKMKLHPKTRTRVEALLGFDQNG